MAAGGGRLVAEEQRIRPPDPHKEGEKRTIRNVYVNRSKSLDGIAKG